MIEFLNNIDTQVFLFFNGIHFAYLDKLMPLITAKFTWVPMYATILFVLFKGYSWKQGLALLLGIVLAITLADQICATFIRPVVERMRPSNIDNPLSPFVHIVNGYRGGRYGFPSCHAANSFALAAIVSLIVRYRRCSLFIFGWAALNSYSRIYLGVHYPGDLICGAIIGMACGAFCYYVTCYFAGIRRRAKDYTPMSVIYATEAGPLLAPVLGLKIVNIRISDVFTAAGYATILTLATVALFL